MHRPAANALDKAPLDMACKKRTGWEDLNRASGYLLHPKHRRQLSDGGQVRISGTDEDKPIGNSILRRRSTIVLSRLHHVRSDRKLPMVRRRCRGNERHSLGVARVATFIVAHHLSPSFGSATTRRSSSGGPVRPYSSSSTTARLRERRTSHPARSEPGLPAHKRSRLLSGSEQRGLRPQRCTKKTFLRHQLHLPNPPVTCRVCQLARQHIAPYREEHPQPRRQQGRDEGAECPRQDETTDTPSSS